MLFTVKQILEKRFKRLIRTALVIAASLLYVSSSAYAALDDFEIPSFSKNLSLDTIIEAGSSEGFLNCTDTIVVGACFWIKCTFVACSFNTSVMIKHYIPDVIVQVYDKPGDAPFSLSDPGTKLISSLLGSGTTGSDVTSVKRTNVVARHSDVIGSPAAFVVAELLSQVPLGLSCDPGSTAMQPYFVSSSNPWFWYTGLFDTIYNATNLLDGRFVGERVSGVDTGMFGSLGAATWGQLYPRTGMVSGTDHYRASAVIAQRTMDQVYDPLFGIYSQELDGRKGSYYIPSTKMSDSDDSEGYWQMLYPKQESTCHIFGDVTEVDGLGLDGYASKRSSNGDYAWHYWRRYKCCQRPSGHSFLYKIEW